MSSRSAKTSGESGEQTRPFDCDLAKPYCAACEICEEARHLHTEKSKVRGG